MSDIVWEDPPRRIKWDVPLELLRENPGRWARLLEDDKAGKMSVTAAYLKKRNPGFEFVSRAVDGKSVLYGRYVKPDE